MSTATAVTVDRVRAKYRVMMRRGEVLELGRLVGLSERSVRNLIEGEGAPVRGRMLPGTKRAYFDREEVLNAIFA